MLKTIGLFLLVVIAGLISVVAVVRLSNVVPFAYDDLSYPLCRMWTGRCDPALVEDVKWTGIVLFSSLSAFILGSLKMVFPHW